MGPAARSACRSPTPAPRVLARHRLRRAGFFFDFTGAAASHALNGDGPELIMPAVIGTFILAGSYFLRPESRRLG